MRPTVTSGPVVSYTAVSPLPAMRCRHCMQAVCSLLRYLSGRPGRTLSAIVLCGARKFLSDAGNRYAEIRQHRGHQEVSNN